MKLPFVYNRLASKLNTYINVRNIFLFSRLNECLNQNKLQKNDAHYLNLMDLIFVIPNWSIKFPVQSVNLYVGFPSRHIFYVILILSLIPLVVSTTTMLVSSLRALAFLKSNVTGGYTY